MGNRRLAKILRCTGLAVIVLGALALLPSTVMAATQHGVSIAKNCTQSINQCATDADCPQDADVCNGTQQCATEENPGSNVVDCTITVTNSDGFTDSIMIDEATDTITNAAGGPVSSSTILVSGSTGTVTGTGCAVGQDISAGNTCTLAFGASLSFQANYYTVQAADASPLLDRADILLQDLCDAVGTTG